MGKGFEHCDICKGKYCLYCEDRRKKWELAKAEEEKKDPRIKLHSLIRQKEIMSNLGMDTSEISFEIDAQEQKCNAEYKRLFPNGPQLIFTANINDPKSMAVLKKVFNANTISRAFSGDGGGVEELIENIEKELA